MHLSSGIATVAQPLSFANTLTLTVQKQCRKELDHHSIPVYRSSLVRLNDVDSLGPGQRRSLTRPQDFVVPRGAGKDHTSIL